MSCILVDVKGLVRRGWRRSGLALGALCLGALERPAAAADCPLSEHASSGGGFCCPEGTTFQASIGNCTVNAPIVDAQDVAKQRQAGQESSLYVIPQIRLADASASPPAWTMTIDGKPATTKHGSILVFQTSSATTVRVDVSAPGYESRHFEALVDKGVAVPLVVDATLHRRSRFVKVTLPRHELANVYLVDGNDQPLAPPCKLLETSCEFRIPLDVEWFHVRLAGTHNFESDRIRGWDAKLTTETDDESVEVNIGFGERRGVTPGAVFTVGTIVGLTALGLMIGGFATNTTTDVGTSDGLLIASGVVAALDIVGMGTTLLFGSRSDRTTLAVKYIGPTGAPAIAPLMEVNGVLARETGSRVHVALSPTGFVVRW